MMNFDMRNMSKLVSPGNISIFLLTFAGLWAFENVKLLQNIKGPQRLAAFAAYGIIVTAVTMMISETMKGEREEKEKDKTKQQFYMGIDEEEEDEKLVKINEI